MNNDSVSVGVTGIINSQSVLITNKSANGWTVINELISNKNQENAFFVCDINDIIEKYRTWERLLPRVYPHYAVKCNDHPIVLQVLAQLGLGFDCASRNEINKILSLNVDPSRIIYAHTTKVLSHIKHAASVNVTLTTFDNEMELHKLKKLFPHVRAILRIRFDAKAISNYGSKFGCDANTEAPLLLRKAKELGINVVGVSFHVGSGCTEPLAFQGAIAAARSVFDSASKLGYKMNILDIGGGYPGDSSAVLLEFAEVINKAIDDYFPQDDVTVISEPGTYFVDSAFTLVCNIHSLKKIQEGSRTTFMYYVNDGTYGSLSDVVAYNYTRIPHPLKKSSTSTKYSSVVWGPTCNSLDRIIADQLLPEMEVGDWLAFTTAGAYTNTMSTSFNGFDQSEVFAFINKDNWSLLKQVQNLPQENNCN